MLSVSAVRDFLNAVTEEYIAARRERDTARANLAARDAALQDVLHRLYHEITDGQELKPRARRPTHSD